MLGYRPNDFRAFFVNSTYRLEVQMAYEEYVEHESESVENGELRRSRTTTRRRIRRAATVHYVKAMPESRELLKEICSTPMRLMNELAQTMTYADQEQLVRLDKVERARLVEELGVSQKMLEVALAKLVKAKAIRRIDRGLYSVNPRYYAKGSDSDIDRLVRTFDKITGNPERDFSEE